MVRRLGLGKNNHLTYASLALNPRYKTNTAQKEMHRQQNGQKLKLTTILAPEQEHMTLETKTSKMGSDTTATIMQNSKKT